MGPGFDCLGMALDIWNEVRVEAGPGGVTIEGEGAETLERDESNLVHRSIARVFQETGTTMPDLAVACRNAIPLARGLGSSAGGGRCGPGAWTSDGLGPQTSLDLRRAWTSDELGA